LVFHPSQFFLSPYGFVHPRMTIFWHPSVECVDFFVPSSVDKPFQCCVLVNACFSTGRLTAIPVFFGFTPLEGSPGGLTPLGFFSLQLSASLLRLQGLFVSEPFSWFLCLFSYQRFFFSLSVWRHGFPGNDPLVFFSDGEFSSLAPGAFLSLWLEPGVDLCLPPSFFLRLSQWHSISNSFFLCFSSVPVYRRDRPGASFFLSWRSGLVCAFSGGLFPQNFC